MSTKRKYYETKSVDSAKKYAKEKYPQFEQHRFKETENNGLLENNSIEAQVCLNILWTYRNSLDGLAYTDPCPCQVMKHIPSYYKHQFECFDYEGDPTKNTWYIWFQIGLASM